MTHSRPARRAFRSAWIAGCAAVVLAGAGAGAMQAAKTTKDGIYSEEQAARGQTAYAERCASCHGEDLSGVDGPSLKGADFVISWDGQGLDALAGRIQDTMPADSPGSLTAEVTADVVAFLLKSSGFPAGPQALSSVRTEQAKVIFVQP